MKDNTNEEIMDLNLDGAGAYKHKKKSSKGVVIALVVLLILFVGLSVALFFLLRERLAPEPVFQEESMESTVTEESSVEESSDEPELPPPPVRDFSKVSETQISVNKYFYYGPHMGLHGEVEYAPEENNSVQKVYARVYRDIQVVDNSPTMEQEMCFSYEEGILKVWMADVIDEGLCLEQLPEGDYLLLIAVVDGENNETLLSLADVSEMEPLEYYTITHEGKNRRIDVAPGSMVDDENLEVNSFTLLCKETELPEEIYDIVLDPGHGTCDGGTVSVAPILDKNGNVYCERDVALSIAKKVKASLEEMGYKVALTHDGSEGTTSYAWCYWNAYKEGNRVWNACTPKPKYSISIHLNNVEGKIATPGIELYSSIHAGVRLSKRILEQVTANTLMPTSSKKPNRVEGLPGAYKWRLSDAPNSDYLYMIREVGGIMTGGRVANHERYGTNKFYNVNFSPEAYLIETGYISDALNMQVLIDDQQNFADCIARGIQEDILSFYEKEL